MCYVNIGMYISRDHELVLIKVEVCRLHVLGVYVYKRNNEITYIETQVMFQLSVVIPALLN